MNKRTTRFDDEAIDLNSLLEGLFDSPKFEDYVFIEALKKRRIIINSPIDDCIVERVIMQIIRWNEEDSGKLKEMRKPITIILNTPGGLVGIGLVLCNVIEQSETPVHIVALAYASSMGSMILMAGHKRFAYPFTNILIHDGSIGLSGSMSKVRDTMDFQEEKENQSKEFILAHTKISEEKYKENYTKEWWMTAKTAKELGIVDYIIGEDEIKFGELFQ